MTTFHASTRARAACLLLGALLYALLHPAGRASAQFDVTDFLNQGRSAESKPAGEESKVTARLVPVSDESGVVRLEITVSVPADSYTYSTKKSFSGATRFDLNETSALKAVDDEYRPDHAPKPETDEQLGPVERHYRDTTWTRRFRVLQTADAASLKIAGDVRYQICTKNSCTPYKTPFVAVLAGSEVEAAAAPVVYSLKTRPTRPSGGKDRPDPLELEVVLAPEDAQPGQKVTLSVTARVDEGWHTFALTQNPRHYGRPTEINIAAVANLKPLGEGFEPSHPPETEDALNDGKIQLVHYGEITWKREYEVLPTAADAGYGIAGEVRYQVCATSCLPARPVDFTLGKVERPVADDSAGGSPLQSTTDDGAASMLSLDFQVTDTDGSRGLWYYMLSAFLGGMILNIMPCVLPVLAIKVLSFVQQAGESRARILALNLAYSVGVIGVFLLLATLAVTLNLGWGGLFQKPEFNLIMACLIFAMGLSLLGVFEIPVPGFVGSAAGGHQQEGISGAFLTGIFATLLATPCSGPFLGAALGWSMKQSAMTVYLVWGTMGAGMAFPYVLFGMFPAAIKYLPKPGPWMVRFKELAGFVLMGTVIFFVYFIEERFIVPLLIMMLGIALGLWMLGNLYDHSSHIRHKTTVRISAFLLTGLICGFGYNLSRGASEDSTLPWQPFTEERLAQSLAEGRTVLIDFTADWCATCKTVEGIALNRAETRKFVDRHNIVPLMADYTDYSDEITTWLQRFDSRSVPLTVIFPGKQPVPPIVIRDFYTQGTLLEKLQQAVDVQGGGPSPSAKPPEVAQQGTAAAVN